MSALYLIGAGLVVSGQLLPIAINIGMFGIWGVSKVAQGVYYLASGTPAETEDERLRRLIREELGNVEGLKNIEDSSKTEEDVVDDALAEDG